MHTATTYQAGATVTFYGVDHPVAPIITAHGVTLGYLPTRSVGHYRDGMLQGITIHESPYDARRYRDRMNGEAGKRPLPYLNRYHLID